MSEWEFEMRVRTIVYVTVEADDRDEALQKANAGDWESEHTAETIDWDVIREVKRR